MAKQAPVFVEVDVGSLNQEQHELFICYLRAKDSFRHSLQSIAGEGERILFTEKFGTEAHPEWSKLKIASIKAQPKVDKPKLSLAEWREQMRSAIISYGDQ